jgi:hypothetical protein
MILGEVKSPGTCQIGLLLFLVALLLVGCQNPGIVQVSGNTYMLSREDHAGIFGSASRLKAGVIRDANAFAAKQGKVAVPISAKEHQMGALADWASFEYQFKLLEKDDPEAKNASMVIEVTPPTRPIGIVVTTPRQPPSNLPINLGGGYSIKAIIDHGKYLELQDKSFWEISAADRSDSGLWVSNSRITIIESDEPGYPYKLVNTDDKGVVNAKPLNR